MKSDGGFSFVEQLLTIAIILFLALTIIPLTAKMRQNLHEEKLAFYASEVALNGAKLVSYYGQTEGEMAIEGFDYEWSYKEGGVCVTYMVIEQKREKCINL